MTKLPATSMQGLCRICLKTENGMVMFYHNKSEAEGILHTIEEMFNKITGVQTSFGDGLPELICSSCLDKLETAYHFREQCLQSENILQNHKFGVNLDIKIAEKDKKVLSTDPNIKLEYEKYLDKTRDPVCAVIKEDEKSQDDSAKTMQMAMTCDICHKSFQSLFAKRNHRESHMTNTKRNNYNYKRKQTISGYNIKNIEVRSEPNELFSCKYCPRRFKSDHAFSKHIRNHAISFSSEIHTCQLCNKVYKTVHILNRHKKVEHQLNIQKSSTSYLCSYCGKIFATKGSLKLHIKGHEGHKVYKCDYCDKMFYASFTKLVHERIHTNETPYICSYCGHKFKASGSLKVHVRKHTGDFPHKCLIENCNKAFAQSSELKMHIRSNHTGERDYQCSECDKNFITKQHLKQHFQRNHAPKPTEKNFKCYVCSNSYFTKQSVTKHLKQVHKITKYTGQVNA